MNRHPAPPAPRHRAAPPAAPVRAVVGAATLLGVCLFAVALTVPDVPPAPLISPTAHEQSAEVADRHVLISRSARRISTAERARLAAQADRQAVEAAMLREGRSAIHDRVMRRLAAEATRRARIEARQARAEAAEKREIAQALAAAAVNPGTLRAQARDLMLAHGYTADQWPYLDQLVMRESGWNPLAQNPSSGAYGLPQALPGTKMAAVGADWRTNPATQIRWMLGYIDIRYGTPEAAWGHSQSVGWY